MKVVKAGTMPTGRLIRCVLASGGVWLGCQLDHAEFQRSNICAVRRNGEAKICLIHRFERVAKFGQKRQEAPCQGAMFLVIKVLPNKAAGFGQTRQVRRIR